MLEKKSIFLSQIFFSRIVGVFGDGGSLLRLTYAGGSATVDSGEGSFYTFQTTATYTEGSQDWSLSGGNSLQTTLYGNSADETLSLSGNGTDSYQYTQYYNFCPNGQWLATSGSGQSRGSSWGYGSISASYTASGGFSSLDPAWSNASDPGTAITRASEWYGSVSGSGSYTTSYGYSTSSIPSCNGTWDTCSFVPLFIARPILLCYTQQSENHIPEQSRL